MNAESGPPPRKSLTELLRMLRTQATLLARKEVDLVKAEAVANVKAETAMIVFLAIAAGSGALACLTILATIIIVLQYFMPLWLAALIVSVVLVLFSLIAAYIGLKKSVKSPWVRTREILRSDIKMAKEGFA